MGDNCRNTWFKTFSSFSYRPRYKWKDFWSGWLWSVDYMLARHHCNQSIPESTPCRSQTTFTQQLASVTQCGVWMFSRPWQMSLTAWSVLTAQTNTIMGFRDLIQMVTIDILWCVIVLVILRDFCLAFSVLSLQKLIFRVSRMMSCKQANHCGVKTNSAGPRTSGHDSTVNNKDDICWVTLYTFRCTTVADTGVKCCHVFASLPKEKMYLRKECFSI